MLGKRKYLKFWDLLHLIQPLDTHPLAFSLLNHISEITIVKPCRRKAFYADLWLGIDRCLQQE